MTKRRLLAAAVAAIALVMATAATAWAAAPPPNDNRDNAIVLPGLPATVTGTTVGSTVQPTEPSSQCASTAGSVWYSLTIGATAPGDLAIQLDANGNLDAAADVFVKQRSQDIPVTCQRTDRNGEAIFDFHPQADTTYLIRVAQLANSDPGSFRLRAFIPPPPASPPGTPLGIKGASASLQRVVGNSRAYSMTMTAGTSYVVNLVSHIQGCMRLAIYGPDASSFDGQPVAQQFCQGGKLFTPRATGRYSFVVNADNNTIGGQPYHLQVAPAGPAETTPGLPLENYAKVKGHLSGAHTGVLRLYRFDVTARSDLELNLDTGASFDLQLRKSGGRIIDCACGDSGDQTINRVMRPGRYYVAVRSQDFSTGNFTLLRRTRAITYTQLLIDGSRYAVLPPGDPSTISVYVSAGATGTAQVEIDRFDPVAGWQYNRTVKLPISGGHGSFAFTPPSIGQWRAEASFLGSHGFAASASKPARVLAAGPLRDDGVADALGPPGWFTAGR